jgi:hypothetical protein
LYSRIAKEEDNEMTEHWKHEATDGVLSHSCCQLINLNAIDRSIFCRCRCAAHSVRPRPQAKFSGHLRILSREHLSDLRRSKCHSTTHIHPFHHCYTTPVLSTEICHLGEFTVVLELSDQLYMCSLGNGHIDTPGSLSKHDAAQRSELEFAHFLLMACTRCIFGGQLKYCLP